MASNIYVFTNSYKPVLGGIQTVTSQFAEECVRRGLSIVVITKLYPRSLKIRENIDGLNVLRLPFSLFSGSLRNKLQYTICYIVLFFQFLYKKPKTVYIHFPLEQSEVLVALRRLFNFKIITCFHGHDVLRYKEGYSTNSYGYEAQYRLLQLSHKVTACSKYLAHEVSSIFNFREVDVVYNGVDLSRFKEVYPLPPNIDKSYLFAFGRLEQIKGFDLLISGYAKLHSRFDVKLLIAGDGSERNNLQKLIDSLGLTEKVILLGRLTPCEIVQYSQNAQINIIPSRREPFGIVALESIAAKRPLIATNTGGLPEVIDSRFGISVNPDPESLASAIELVLNDAKFFSFEDSEAYVDQFTIGRMVDKYLELSLV